MTASSLNVNTLATPLGGDRVNLGGLRPWWDTTDRHTPKAEVGGRGRGPPVSPVAWPGAGAAHRGGPQRAGGVLQRGAGVRPATDRPRPGGPLPPCGAGFQGSGWCLLRCTLCLMLAAETLCGRHHPFATAIREAATCIDGSVEIHRNTM